MPCAPDMERKRAMALVVNAEPVPLVSDAFGVVRVKNTRVPLDTIVGAFDDGATAEEIVQQYPTLRLDDVYAVLTYYLRHREEVAQYLRERELRAGEIRRENERRFDPIGVRERLLARRAAQG